MRPPIIVSVSASTRNCPIITPGLAPSALRMPISLVLSATDTSMMFMIPIPPTSNEMAAMAARNVERVFMTSCDISTREAALMTMK